MLHVQVKSISKWDVVLQKAEFEFNCSNNRRIEFAPTEILLGKNPQGPLDLIPLLKTVRISKLYMRGLKISLLFRLKHMRI